MNSPSHTFSRAAALRGLAAGVALGAAIPANAAEPAAAMPSPGEALARLQRGNARYRLDEAVNCNKNYNRRAELVAGQSPFAIVLGCADSRVPPEVVFDQRLGDVFVVRVAGNVADDIAIGSLEYAIEHFHSPLLLVLGHSKCGAVTATLGAVETGTYVPGFVGAIVKAIAPAAARALHEPDDRLNHAIRYNVLEVVADLRSRSTVVASAETNGKLRLLGAVYDLSSGHVRIE